MDIRLKQQQIEAALRDYIIKQGIDLTGRTVEIVFTAGRGGNGLMADIALGEGVFKADLVPLHRQFEEVQTPLVESFAIITTNDLPALANDTNITELLKPNPPTVCANKTAQEEGSKPVINLFN